MGFSLKQSLRIFSFTLLASTSVLPSLAHGMTYEDLRRTIEKNEIRKLEDLLPLLSQEFRSSYNLMFQSQSLQEASPLAPRVIMFEPNNGLTIAFNGEPAQNGFDRLEAIQFRENLRSFDFYEITFPESNLQLAQASFSEANPGKCLKCHTSDPRPNWESYPIWPGSYFGNQDLLHLIERDFSNDVSQSNQFFVDSLRTFITRYKLHSRYRNLGNVELNYDPSDEKEHSGNRRLTQHLSIQNFRRMARLLRDTPYYHEYKFALLAILLCEKPLTESMSFFPKGFPDFPDYIPDGSYARDFQSLFEARGVYLRDYFMSFKNQVSYSPNMATPGTATVELAGAIVEGDPELLKYGELSDYEYHGVEHKRFQMSRESCQKFAPLSRKELAKVPLPRQEKMIRSAQIPQPLRSCVRCHLSPDQQAPHIAFDDLNRLKSHLKRTGYPRGTFQDEFLYRISTSAAAERMPPEGMNSADQELVYKFVRELTSP